MKLEDKKETKREIVESDLKYSAFDSQPDLKVIENLQEQHHKMLGTLKNKEHHLDPIIHWIKSGNTDAAYTAIEKYFFYKKKDSLTRQ